MSYSTMILTPARCTGCKGGNICDISQWRDSALGDWFFGGAGQQKETGAGAGVEWEGGVAGPEDGGWSHS